MKFGYRRFGTTYRYHLQGSTSSYQPQTCASWHPTTVKDSNTQLLKPEINGSAFVTSQWHGMVLYQIFMKNQSVFSITTGTKDKA